MNEETYKEVCEKRLRSLYQDLYFCKVSDILRVREVINETIFAVELLYPDCDIDSCKYHRGQPR